MAKRRNPGLVEHLESRIQFSAVSPLAVLHQAVASNAVHASLSHALMGVGTPQKLAGLTISGNPHGKNLAPTPADPTAVTQVGLTDAQYAATNPGDANRDYVVNFADCAIVSNNYGSTTSGGLAAGDLNLDGVVNFADYTLISNNYGKTYNPPPVANPIAVTSQNMTSFNELDITGTAGDDNILVTQAGNTLNVTANGQTSNYIAGSYGNLVIHAGAGNDSVTVDPSVNIITLLYGDDGNDTLINRTSAKATIVDIDSFSNTVAGNGVNTSYWVNPNDVVNASSTEIANTAVNRVANFYQPSIGAVPRALNGPNLADPTDGGATHRVTANSFWGTGPVANDINQGSIGDCYYLAPLAALANNTPLKFQNTGVDLGDGTYAVRYIRNGVTSFVRVDGDLSNNYYTHAGATGNIWGTIYEKAYAYFRTGANTYDSLNSGNPTYSLKDLGFNSQTISATSSASTILSSINTALSAGRPVVAFTQAVASNAPVIGYHCYTIVGAYQDASGTVYVQLRNPWGFDGAGSDSNPNDGLQTLSYSTFASNYYALCYGVA